MATEITVDETTLNVEITVSNERGPAGQDGASEWGDIGGTLADQTDLQAALDAKAPLASPTFTGTVTADHIHGNLAGSLYMHVRAGENLSKGDPVYVSGSHGSGATMIPIVSRADASDPAKMPAIAIMDAAVSANANGHAVLSGTITDFNTNAYTVNATLYVANGGGLTATKPTNVQPVARVERVNTNNGGIVVKVNGLYSDISPANIGAAPTIHTHTSADITDATSSATPNTVVKRDSVGSAAFNNVQADYVLGGNFTNGAAIFEGGLELYKNDVISQLNQASVTETRTYNLPDASGTLMLGSQNLSDLTSQSTARTNLGATATGDALFTAATAAAARTTISAAPQNIPITTESTTARTLSASDLGTKIRVTNASGCAMTIPASLGVAGAAIIVRRATGAGAISFILGGGVTVNNSGVASITAGQEFALVAVGANEWDFV